VARRLKGREQQTDLEWWAELDESGTIITFTTSFTDPELLS
jgi:uncharacterized OB-fold protein